MTGALIDTHCHLALLEQRGLLDSALERAEQAGVIAMVTIGVNLEDSERNRSIAERSPRVWFTVGWDPQQDHAPDRAELEELSALLRHPRAVAVGEVGLDTNFRPGYHETPLEVQRRSFRLMLELAAEHGKPVVIHDRDAHDAVLDELTAGPPPAGVVMHCFTGDATHVHRCAERGCVVSFSGIVTFRNARGIQAAAREVAPDLYVVETDSPFLAPHPHRGSVNEPARVADTARCVAELRESTFEAVCDETTATALRVFRLPGSAAAA